MLNKSEIFTKIENYENLEKELKKEIRATPFFKIYYFGLKNGHIYHTDLFKYNNCLNITEIYIKDICIPVCYDKIFLRKHGHMIRLFLSLTIYLFNKEISEEEYVMIDVPANILYAKNYVIVKFLNNLESKIIKNELKRQESNLNFIKNEIDKLIIKMNKDNFKLSLKKYKK
jgi:hypothetical protein